MLSEYDGTQWQQPQSILKFGRRDMVKDYQLLMCNDTVLAAVSLIPEGRDRVKGLTF